MWCWACVSHAIVQTHWYRSLNVPNIKHLILKRQDFFTVCLESQSLDVLLVVNLSFMSGVRQMTPFGWVHHIKCQVYKGYMEKIFFKEPFMLRPLWLLKSCSWEVGKLCSCLLHCTLRIFLHFSPSLCCHGTVESLSRILWMMHVVHNK